MFFMAFLGAGARRLPEQQTAGQRTAGESAPRHFPPWLLQEEEEPWRSPWGACPGAASGALPALYPPPCEPNTGPGTETVKKEAMALEGWLCG